MDDKKVLVLFSGGKDSLLSTCYLIEKGYKVFLVHYDNGASIDTEIIKDEKSMSSVEFTANELIEKYGQDRVEFLGTKFIAGTWRRFFLPYLNMTPNDISKKYGQLPHSQFNCLTCRTSMYLYSIALCKVLGINNIAEGARTSQQFVIELEPMLNKYKELLMKYDINLLLPVLNITDDFERENLLLLRGISSSRLEPQCLLGVSIDNKYPITEEIIESVMQYYNKEVEPKIDDTIGILDKKVSWQLKMEYIPHYLKKGK